METITNLSAHVLAEKIKAAELSALKAPSHSTPDYPECPDLVAG